METRDKREASDNRLVTIVDRLRSTADVDCVFGKPFEAHGKMYVPVASVRYGFGGGGHGEDESKNGSGGGMGGGVKTKPAGVLEISAEGARFIRFEPSWRGLAAIWLGMWFATRLVGALRRR